MEASLNWGDIIFGPRTKAEIEATLIGIGWKILENIASMNNYQKVLESIWKS